jgi:hypothetical protein
MSTVTVVSLVNRAQVILQDTVDPGVRWPVLELQDWLNDSYREIVNARPDANSQSGSFTCAAGTRQVLTTRFASALRLIDVVRNIAATSAKKAVRLLDRAVLDDQRRGWHGETGKVDIEYFMFDPRLPREFLVYPPATTSAELEVVYSLVPESHTLTEAELTSAPSSATIKLVDSYANIMLDYMLYRAYSKDAEYAANAQRALAHFQAMQNALGIKTQSDISANPQDLGDRTVR